MNDESRTPGAEIIPFALPGDDPVRKQFAAKWATAPIAEISADAMRVRPLVEATPAAPYPIEALGDVLGPAASAIAAKIKCSTAMTASSVLAVASHAAQGLADVLLPYGRRGR